MLARTGQDQPICVFPTGGPLSADMPDPPATPAGEHGSARRPAGICLVSGRRAEIARLHRVHQRSPGRQLHRNHPGRLQSGPAFESYGRAQGGNAPGRRRSGLRVHDRAQRTAFGRVSPRSKHGSATPPSSSGRNETRTGELVERGVAGLFSPIRPRTTRIGGRRP